MTKNTAVPAVPTVSDPGMYSLLQALKQNVQSGQNNLATANANIASVQNSVTSLQGTVLLKANNLSDVASVSQAQINLSLQPGVNVQVFDANTLKSNVGANLTKGFTASSFNNGTKSSGTFTPDPTNGNLQIVTNAGAHVLAEPATDCSMVILYVNTAGAGAISYSGFNKVVNANLLTTTNGNSFMAFITRINTVGLLVWIPMQ